MTAFADTSFLCALHVPLVHSARAIAWHRRQRDPIFISGLVAFEFRQSVRLQAFRFSADRTAGFDPRTAEAALRQFEANLTAGAFALAATELADVLDFAERISARHTPAKGCRSLDVLHVATAQHLGVRRFLSFDEKQRALAKAAGLDVRP